MVGLLEGECAGKFQVCHVESNLEAEGRERSRQVRNSAQSEGSYKVIKIGSSKIARSA